MGQLAVVDLVGISDDQRCLRLTENFFQLKTSHRARGDDVPQNIAGADRRQLIRITDEQHLAGVRDRLSAATRSG